MISSQRDLIAPKELASSLETEVGTEEVNDLGEIVMCRTSDSVRLHSLSLVLRSVKILEGLACVHLLPHLMIKQGWHRGQGLAAAQAKMQRHHLHKCSELQVLLLLLSAQRLI